MSERTLTTRWKSVVDPSVKSSASQVGATTSAATKKASVGWSALGSAIGNVVAQGVSRAIDATAAFVGAAASASDSGDKFVQTMKFAGLKNGAITKAAKEVRAYADQTVFGLSDVQNTTAQLASNGVKDYVGLTKAAGNLTAVAGGGAEAFKSVAMMLTQTAGAGKLTTENWNQLTDAIPGAAGPMMKAMKEAGAYTGNFRDAMAAGEITSKEFNAALSELGNKPIAVEAAKSTKTFEGALGNLEATITGAFTDALDSMKPQITAFINGLTDGVDKLAEVGGWVSENSGALSALGATLGVVALGWLGLAAAQGIAAAGGVVAWITQITAVSKVWAGVQAALNVVLNANPIGLIVIAIAALVAGIIVAYNNCEQFRNVVDGAMKAVGGVFQWLWKSAVEPAMRGIGVVVKWLDQNVIKPSMEAIKPALRQAGEVAKWLYDSAIAPAFKGVGVVALWLWNNAIQPAMRGIGPTLQVVGGVAKWLYDSAIAPAFRGIGVVVEWLWNSAIAPAFKNIPKAFELASAGAQILMARFQIAFQAIGAVARWLWNNAVMPAVQGMLRGFAMAASGAAAMLGALGNVPGFEWAKGAADGLRGVAKGATDAANNLKAIPNPKVNTSGAVGEVGRLETAIASIKDKIVQAKAKGDLRGAAALEAKMNKLKDKLVVAKSKADTKGIDQVRAVMARLKGKIVKAKAKGDWKQVDHLRNKMKVLKNRIVTAKAKADSKPVDKVAKSMKTLKGKSVTAKAKGDSKPVDKVAKSIKGLKSKTVTTKAKGDGKQVDSLARKIKAVKSKTVTVTANVRKTGISRVSVKAGGGDSVRIVASARGNILDGRGVRRFASGGIEDHRAQIARAGAMRLWAEPETGGEAYIPLAASKRERSREIWWETGRRLGVVERADGGVAGGRRASAGADDLAALVVALERLTQRVMTRDDLMILLDVLRRASPTPKVVTRL